jgi:hypothetical protein
MPPLKSRRLLSIFQLLIAGIGAAFRQDYNEFYPCHEIHAYAAMQLAGRLSKRVVGPCRNQYLRNLVR